jgi:hypothetical protein
VHMFLLEACAVEASHIRGPRTLGFGQSALWIYYYEAVLSIQLRPVHVVQIASSSFPSDAGFIGVFLSVYTP